MPFCLGFKGMAIASREGENMHPRSRMKGEGNFIASVLDGDVYAKILGKERTSL